jgi:hypothetical protein
MNLFNYFVTPGGNFFHHIILLNINTLHFSQKVGFTKVTRYFEGNNILQILYITLL